MKAHRPEAWIWPLAVLPMAWLAMVATQAHQGAVAAQEKLDPAAWGEDHVGVPIPDYVTGDECLFCHRDIGQGWDTDPHARTMQYAVKAKPLIDKLREAPELQAFADEIQFVLGDKKDVRYLKRGEGYGKADISSFHWSPGADDEPGHFTNSDNPHWNNEKFAESCAGCHATAVDTELHAFSVACMDCVSCHGVVPLEHSGDPARALLSPHSNPEARLIASACGQCHLRGGKSRSTGLPYPNQFFTGDNLFKDYEVDFSDDFMAKLNPGDWHVYENVRDMAINGETRVTCLSCHEIHRNSSEIHTGLRKTDSCYTCHIEGEEMSKLVEYVDHSAVCEY